MEISEKKYLIDKKTTIAFAKMEKKDLVRVFIKGGIISPGDFLKIIETAYELGTDYVHFGSRQDILFPVYENSKEILDKTFKSIETEYDLGVGQYQNIVSSYVALDVMSSKRWLAPHIYHYILDSFEYRPKLKVNIVDPSQSLVPLFTGNINFIASNIENYWYLYLRFKVFGDKAWALPILVFGSEIAKVAEAIEHIYSQTHPQSYEEVFHKLLENTKFHYQSYEKPLVYPDSNFPYYEGMNRYEEGKYWLGLYWRNNKFYLSFLKELCKLCIETKIGKISLSPWKSFIVHGILEKDRLAWEKLMGRHGINMRHSALELNWHLPVLDEEALELKNYLVRALDQQDISTHGLTFTIITTGEVVLFTSVVIEKCAKNTKNDPDIFNILYSKDFNPNLSEYFIYAKQINKEIIPALLIELSHMYYEQLNTPITFVDGYPIHKIKSPKQIFQCTNCLTIYDEDYGDDMANVKPGVPFLHLPNDYKCPLCTSPKSAYKQLN
jgi:rubredoxin